MLAVAFALVLGLMGFILGMLISAQGQILMASLDGSVNTSPFLSEAGKAKVMGLETDSTQPITPLVSGVT